LLAQENCSACHGETFEGSTVAGWTPNLTPDSATGLGGWSDAEVARAIRGGVGSSGAPLCGTMPRFSAGELSDAQVADIVAYLRSLPAASSPRRGPCRR
jgi:mono/diheme cytochrome c family protein